MFPILHHYEISPFSEKVRRILAFKQIEYHSVRAPAVMPKPDLVALTGGYRKIPVLQLGNHVYCDTALIARVLERIQPTPTLYPSRLAEIVAEWADTVLFSAAAPMGLRPSRFEPLQELLTPDELAKIIEDRATMQSDAKRSFLSSTAAQSHMQSYLEKLDGELAQQEYLLGAAPCIADFSVYHCLWFLKTLAPEPLAPFENVRRWLEHLAAIPDAKCTSLPSVEALEICRRAGHRDGPVSGHFSSVPPGPGNPLAGAAQSSGALNVGQPVVIRATDYGRDPVEGELVTVNDQEFALRREDPRAGTVFVHFPRVGYEAKPKK